MRHDTITAVLAAATDWRTLPGLFDEQMPETPYAESVSALLAYLSDPQMTLPPILLGPYDQPIYEGFAALRELVDWKNFRIKADTCRLKLVSGSSDEVLLKTSPDSWTNIYLLNYVLLASIIPDRQSAVVVTMRDDGLRILEWIAHYQALGFEKIFIYSNDNRDGSDRLLECLADAGVISFIRNDVTGQESPQRKAFEHSLWRLPELRQFKWVFYADSDEFLRLSDLHDHSIASLLNDVEARYQSRLPSAICYHWKWFVSQGTIFQSEEPLISRFQHSIPHVSVKSIVHLCDVLTMRKLHFPLCNPSGFFVDSMLAEIPQSLSVDQQQLWAYDTPQYLGGQLNHYWTKSFQEFVVKKTRGDSLQNDDYRREFEQFFVWNAPETESNKDTSPELYLARILRNKEVLRQIEKVRIADDEVRAEQKTMLDGSGGEEGLRDLYLKHSISG